MQLDEKDILDEKSSRRRFARKTVGQSEVASPPPLQGTVPLAASQNTWIPLLDKIFNWATYGVLFLLPIFFLPLGTDILEFHKQTLLFVGTFIMLVAYALRGTLSGSFDIKASRVYLGMGAWLLAWLFASIFSYYPYNSFVGIEKQEMVSFTTAAAYVLFIILLAQRAHAQEIVKGLYALYASVAIASVIGILQLFNIFLLPWAFTKTAGFNVIGQFDIWGAVCAVLLTVALNHIVYLSSTQSERKNSISGLLALFIGICLVTLLLIGDWRLWAGVIGGLAFSLSFLYVKLPHNQRIGWLLLPAFVMVFSLTMAIFQPRTVQLPLSAQPTWMTSGSIAVQTLLKSPLFGTGPGNFISAYTQFRPQEINKANYLQLWTTRFDQSNAYILTLLAEGGLIGLAGILLFAFFFLGHVLPRILREDLNEHSILLLAALSGLGALTIELFLKPANITILFVGCALLAYVLAMTSRRTQMIEGNSNRFLIISSLVLYTGVSLGFVGVFFLAKRYMAEYSFASALELDQKLGRQQQTQTQPDQKDVDALITKLVSATSQNPYHTTYPRLLSQALSYRLNGILATGDASKPETMQQVQAITSNAIDAAKRSIDLAPRDIRNVENMASLYQTIAPFVGGADELVTKTFKTAFELDPANPTHHVNLARFYLSTAAIQAQRAENQKDETKKAEEKALSRTTLEMAPPELQVALKLKSDFAAAYYYLALISAQKNNKDESLAHLDKAITMNTTLANQGSFDAPLFVNIALTYRAFDQKDKAETALKLALNIQPDLPGALWQYALLLADTDRKGDALSILDRLAKTDPSNQAIKDKIQELRNPSAQKETKPVSEPESPPTPEPVAPPAELPTPAPAEKPVKE